MAMTDQDREWFRAYEKLGDDDAEFVGHAVDRVRKAMKGVGVEPANDDRVESLVAAITRYLIESTSKPKNPRIEPCCDNEQRTI